MGLLVCVKYILFCVLSIDLLSYSYVKRHICMYSYVHILMLLQVRIKMCHISTQEVNDTLYGCIAACTCTQVFMWGINYVNTREAEFTQLSNKYNEILYTLANKLQTYSLGCDYNLTEYSFEMVHLTNAFNEFFLYNKIYRHFDKH